MSRISHRIEGEIVGAMSRGHITIPMIVQNSALSPDQVRRGIEWLREKGVVRVDFEPEKKCVLGPAGERALRDGLPERRLVDMLREGTEPDRAHDILGNDFGPALGICMKHGWTVMDGGRPMLATYPGKMPAEMALRALKTAGDMTRGSPEMAELERRPGYVSYVSGTTRYALRRDAPPKAAPPGHIDVEARAPDAYPARTHPLREMMGKVRETLVTMGFSEIRGDMVQSSFWNFDALFTPQDHPAREMQDTFFVQDGIRVEHRAARSQLEGVAAAHQNRWGGDWDPGRAAEPVLRTHTTCVTVRHLAENPREDARVFSLGRVFRNEKPSYKHLAEFHQAEGVVAGDDVTLRDLMGMQEEFYRRMGLRRVKFWPTFFPYTEPSLQSMVYSEDLGKWVELFGMGIFRPEVTTPLGISRRVLAWGGGIERMAMLIYGMDDVREFYGNGLGWLRRRAACR